MMIIIIILKTSQTK